MGDLHRRIGELSTVKRELLAFRLGERSGGGERPGTPSGAVRLVAYVVANPGREPPVSELREFLAQRLPAQMVPSAFVWMRALPRLPSGKLDRRSLAPPEWERRALRPERVSPRTELERTIAAAWREVLGIADVGMHDNFFDLGGHSLLMVKLQSRLRQTLSAARADGLSMVDLFRFPTVRSLAVHLGDASGDVSIDAAVVVHEAHDRAELQRAALDRRRRRSVPTGTIADPRAADTTPIVLDAPSGASLAEDAYAR